MSIRILADHCVPNSITESLRHAGHDVTRLRDIMNPATDDLGVIAKAQELQAILLSLDGDFTDIISYPPSRYAGIIALQVRNHPEIIPVVMERLIAFLEERTQQEEYTGLLLIVDAVRIRIRKD